MLSMLTGAYAIIVIAVAVWGIFTGYRKGIYRQVGGVISVAFGIAAVHLFADDFLQWVDSLVPPFFSGFQKSFLAQTLTCSIVYGVVVGIFSLATMPLRMVMRVIDSGVLSSIAGALFKTFQLLMWVSLFYNLLVDIDSSGHLAKVARYHDGNVVEAVLKIAPAVLDFPGAEEVGYYQQLEDAKKIS